jgi:hypothetical protein
MSIWQTIRADLTQRLLKLESLHGVILVLCAVVIAYVIYYALHHIIQAGAIVCALCLGIEGLKKILSNPVKAAIALDLAKASHWAQSELGYDPTGVTAPPKLLAPQSNSHSASSSPQQAPQVAAPAASETIAAQP